MTRPVRALVIGNGPVRYVPVEGTTSGSSVTSLSSSGGDPWTEGPNLIDNGDFENDEDPLENANTTRWVTLAGSETLSAETVDPINGLRSAKVACPDSPGQRGIIWIVDENDFTGPNVEPGTTLRCRVTVRSSGSGIVRTRVQSLDSSQVEIASFTLGLQTLPGEQTYAADMLIPDDVDTATLWINSEGEETVDFNFWVDDIYFGVLTAVP